MQDSVFGFLIEYDDADAAIHRVGGVLLIE
jgi:hypothetical protein